MKVCLGGTFDIIHEGHRVLLEKAFSFGSYVLIGLTDDKFAKKDRKKVSKFETRRKNLVSYLKKKKHRNYEIVKITDPYGPSVEQEDLDYIVTSEGTEFRAHEVNKLRKKNKLKQLKIISVPFVLADDCAPISSRRIRAGEIDKKGRVLRTVVISVGSENINKVKAAEMVFLRMFKKLEVRSIKVSSAVPEQPFGHDTVKGAIERAIKAIRESGGDFGVGIESGLHLVPHVKYYFDVQYCAIVDKMGRITLGHGSGFYYPVSVISDVRKGATVSKAMETLTGVKKIGEKIGAIGFLSKGMLNRERLTEQAVLMALIPRIRKELYF